MFWSAVCSLLMAEGFSFSLDVLFGGLGIRKLQFLIKKINKKNFGCKFFSIFCHQNPGSRWVFNQKYWIRIRIRTQWIRIWNTDKYGTCTKVITKNYLKFYYNDRFFYFTCTGHSWWALWPSQEPHPAVGAPDPGTGLSHLRAAPPEWYSFIHFKSMFKQSFTNFWNHTFLHLDRNSLLLLFKIIFSFTFFKPELTLEITHSA